jgi:arylsulfatase A-like enzyme
MTAAAEWLRTAGPHHDRFFLLVDEFDPHEPFDTPAPWAGRYDPDWEGPLEIWPPYLTGALAEGRLDPRRARQIRANYGAKLSMIDHWLGRVLAALDEAGLAGDTAVVICTDHGHYLGEHDTFGKPFCPVYATLGRIPLLVRWPGVAARDVDALTTTVDLHATIADLFGAEVAHPSHGHSLLPLIEGTATSVRELALFGVWGGHTGVTDGRWRYLAGAGASGFPLSVWSNRWSTMPVHAFPDLRMVPPDGRAELRTVPGTEVPVIRQPLTAGDHLPIWARHPPDPRPRLYDVSVDPAEEEDRAADPLAAGLRDALAGELRRIGAPGDVLARLGVA